MRILVVSHPPLDATTGAAQIALRLAEALRDRGHDALAWSPEPLPPGRWYSTRRRQIRRLEEHLAEARPYDVLDLPAISISRRVGAAGALVVARSIQPDVLYLRETAREERETLPLGRRLVHSIHRRMLSAAIRRGWRRADLVLNLGRHEQEWMARHVPWTAAKAASYVVAPSLEEQAQFAAVRARRRPHGTDDPIRYLWSGRWTPHKGTRRLVRFLEERLALRDDERFTLVGCGDAPLRDLPAHVGSDPRLEIVPAYPREQLPEILACHDAGLFTSTVEGWGLVLNEMLESGVTVFATPVGGVPELAPYFPDHLRPFPPPPDLGLSDLGGEGDFARYHHVFDWRRIAERYERLVAEHAT